ncbi:MAG: hypothetical protein HRU22_14625 [Gammaproteobacteria bacterium]|nr:hypothetical protein [Gammaproteobacteria bacterium]
MMKWILLFCSLILTSQVNAVSMENNIFALSAGEIRYKLGQVTAKNQVTIRIKSPQVIDFLASKTNVALSNLSRADRVIEISLSEGWILQGRINSISVADGSAILEADELFLEQQQLLTTKI